MNVPKAIRSLKSKGFLSISTTPILCRIEVSHPATRLFLSIYYHERRQRTISISASPGPPRSFPIRYVKSRVSLPLPRLLQCQTILVPKSAGCIADEGYAAPWIIACCTVTPTGPYWRRTAYFTLVLLKNPRFYGIISRLFQRGSIRSF